jgi:hypothetical protein
MFRRAANVPKGSRCVYCGGWAQLVEHVIPDLKPYPLPWNERYACSVCNVVKGRKQQRGIQVNELLAATREVRPELHEGPGERASRDERRATMTITTGTTVASSPLCRG